MTAAVRPRSPRGEGDRLRVEIVAATQKLLAETGSADAVSIRLVANVVGVTPPAIYRHFEDKDRLLLAACMANFDELQVVLEAVDLASVPLAERMERLGRSYVDFAVSHPESYRIMFMSTFDLNTQQYSESMLGDTCLTMLLDTVTELIDAGLVRPELAAKGPLHVGALFWASVHGIASLFIAKPGLPWPDKTELSDDVIALAVAGIQVPTKRSRARRP